VAAGVYQILNGVSGKAYTGSSVNLGSRRRKHFADLRRGTHANHKLQGAWRKHGAAAFTFHVLLICAPEDVLLYEQRALDAFGAVAEGYNLSPTATSIRGLVRAPFSAEHRAKLRAARSTRPKETRTPEQRARMVEAQRRLRESGFKPQPINFTAEVRQKIAAALTGKRQTPEALEKMAATKRGKPLTAEHRAKLVAAQAGLWPPERRAMQAEIVRERWRRQKEVAWQPA
jgi:group I intron endonuclease